MTSGFDRWDSTYFGNSHFGDKALINKILWQNLDINPTVFLKVLENRILLEELRCLNFAFDRTCRIGHVVREKFVLAINPKKIPYFEGDILKVDVFLASYSIQDNSGISITIDGEKIPIQHGIANYSRKISTKGDKKLQAVASIKNPATGELTKISSEFNYKILTKMQ
jgi:hypothetical protein